MGVLAVYYAAALSIARFEIALPVGIFTGLAVFIPYIGFATGLALALLQFGDWYGFGAVAVIFALLAFGQLFGFFGVLLALPVSAILSVAVRELRQSYLESTLYNN